MIPSITSETPKNSQTMSAPQTGANITTTPATMLMMAKKIVHPFDEVSDSVESETIPSTTQVMPIMRPTRRSSQSVAAPKLRKATTPAMTKSTPRTM